MKLTIKPKKKKKRNGDRSISNEERKQGSQEEKTESEGIGRKEPTWPDYN